MLIFMLAAFIIVFGGGALDAFLTNRKKRARGRRRRSLPRGSYTV